MRQSVADACAESRVIRTMIHTPLAQWSASMAMARDFAPHGWNAPECGAIAGAFRKASSRNGGGGVVTAYLEDDHAAFYSMIANTKEAIESPESIEGDCKRIYARACAQRIREADATIQAGGESQAPAVLKSLQVEAAISCDSFPVIQDAAAFVAEELPKPDELITGILHQGSKLALGGGSKSFKTWTLLDLGLSVSHGRQWLGHDTRPGRVLYVNFEIPPWSWQNRLRAVASAKGITIEPGRLSVWNLRGKAAEYSSLLPKVRDAVKKDFALIILDPIYKLYGGTDENKAGDVAALLNAIEDLAVQTGAAVAFGAHFSKGNQSQKESIDRISGSGVFARDPDSLLMFTRHEEDDAFTVEAILRNFAPIEPFAVRWRPPLMVPDNGLDPSRLKQIGRKPLHSPDDLLRLLPAGGLPNKDWLQTADNEGISRPSYFRLRKALEQQDRVLFEKVRQQWKPVFTA